MSVCRIEVFECISSAKQPRQRAAPPISSSLPFGPRFVIYLLQNHGGLCRRAHEGPEAPADGEGPCHRHFSGQEACLSFMLIDRHTSAQTPREIQDARGKFELTKGRIILEDFSIHNVIFDDRVNGDSKTALAKSEEGILA